MADKRDFARLAVAFSSLVVAVCAVVVTIKVMNTDPVPIKQQRVLDQDALERQIANHVSGPKPREEPRVSCPVSVVVEPKTRFSCRVWVGSNQKTVYVMVHNDQGELSVSTSPS
ncbi:uncharacterized protein DUF4333 [Herbihabitans rhizosphaerae]|uniref:Uncharacterized protein DUF4333 n=1 Tax=Herbihabitans rhizosphaerae TaxID=1872711 RepID=A0A4Q7KLC5_9PSEU|nr:DUF4333 domain-containing protein [Herbihabitans rhizosphaerae]RZS37468.1 uncharacterized protein DUF4333 [Herbihabitans rhizosphaerae]